MSSLPLGLVLIAVVVAILAIPSNGLASAGPRVLDQAISDSLLRLAAGVLAPEPTVQDILNQLGTGRNAATDLLPNEYFYTLLRGCVRVHLVAEYSGLANSNAVGWYRPGKKNTKQIVIPGPVSAPGGGSFVVDSLATDSAAWIIQRSLSTVFYSQKTFNVDTAQHVRFYPTQNANEYIMFWEDLPFNTDHDFNDLVAVFTLPTGPPTITCAPLSNQSICPGQSICMLFTATDPDGDSLDIKINAPGINRTRRVASGHPDSVCFTVANSGLYTVTLIATDPCATADTCSSSAAIHVDGPPTITLGGDQNLSQCSPAPICVSYSVSDPDGTAGLVESLASGPAGATIDTINNRVCFTASASETDTIIAKVTDRCGQENYDTAVVAVALNRPPSLSFGNDTSISFCEIGFLCLQYTVSDPDGLGGLSEMLVSGAGILDTAANAVCFTENIVGNRIIVKVTDACGAFDLDTIVATIIYDTPPSISFPADSTVRQCNAGPICATYTISDPEGLAGAIESLISGPTGAAIDTAQNTVCFTPVAAGDYTIIAQVINACGLAPHRDTITYHVTINRPPDIAVGNDTALFLCSAVPICRIYTVSDPDGLGGLIEALVAPPPGTSIDTAANRICFTPSVSGTYTLIAKVQDTCGAADFDTFLVHVTLNSSPALAFGQDTSVSLCTPTPICVAYTISDPDGLNGEVERLVSGPAGTAIDTANNRVCLTPTAGGNYTVIAKVTDPCGLTDFDTIVVSVVLNRPPVVSTGGNRTLKICEPGSVCLSGISASDPDGNLNRIYKSPGPGSFDAATGTLCFTAATSGNYCFELVAEDLCGALDKDTICASVSFNAPPTLTLGTIPGPLLFTETTQVCLPVGATDPDAGQQFTVAMIQGTGTWLPIKAYGNLDHLHCFEADTTGCYRFIFEATDSCGLKARDTADVCVQVNLPDTSFQICIDTVNALNGEQVIAHVLGRKVLPMGGFDFLICYDQTALTFITAAQDSTVKFWEYFSYRLGAQAGCSLCPDGVLRLLGVADMNNGSLHPPEAAFTPKGSMAAITFQVTLNRNFIGQCAPLRFCSQNCGDNSISNRSGDTLYLATTGVGDSCFGSDKNPAIRKIVFCDGAICIVPPQDDRGDINLNGLPYEIGDAVLFTNFFIYGNNVWNPQYKNSQILATDVNCDGIVLTLADLVRLIRVVTGDDQPLDCNLGGARLAVAGTTAVELERRGGRLQVWTDGGLELGGVFIHLAAGSGTLGAVNWESVPAGMDTLSRSTGNELRALLLGGRRGIALSAGRHRLFSVDVSGDFEPANVEAQASSPSGDVILAEVRDLSAAIPQSFELAQNYPNPFNAGTTLRFRLGQASSWQLTIFNVVGQSVRQFEGNSEAGWAEISWRGDDTDGGPLGSGIYFARLRAGGFSASRKMLLLK